MLVIVTAEILLGALADRAGQALAHGYGTALAVEAVLLLAAAVVTGSEITIKRVPIEFMEIELAVLDTMGMEYDLTEEYRSANGHTRLVDLTTVPGPLKAPMDKIHPLPFPGLNIDNLPFFAIIAACAEGSTLIHDWVYDNRAIYLTDLNRLGGRLQLLDPHRVLVEGPTRWRAAEMMCPPALRPAVVVLLADDGALGDRVVAEEPVLDLRRADPDAAGLEQVAGATHARVVAVGVTDVGVTGVEPLALEDGPGRLGAAPDSAPLHIHRRR